MFTKYSALAALSLLISVPAFAEETVAPEEVSSQAKINDVELNGRKNINDDINRQVNSDSKADLKEFVRNANALKRLDNPDAKDIKVDVTDKGEMRKFIKEQAGLNDRIVPEEELKITPKKVETPYDKLKRARRGLQ